MSYTLCVFSSVAVQKNTRDQVAVIALDNQHRKPHTLGSVGFTHCTDDWHLLTLEPHLSLGSLKESKI